MQRAMDQVLKEMAPEVAGLYTLAKAISIQDHKRMLDSHAQRVREGHRAMARAAGMEDLIEPEKAEGADDMGDTFTIGDTVHYYGAVTAGNQQTPATAPTSTPAEVAKKAGKTIGTIGKTLLALALTASGAGAGVGIPWLLGAFGQEAPKQEAPSMIDLDRNWNLELVPENAQ